MDQDFIKEILEFDVRLMDCTACELESARDRNDQESIKLWEQELDESIALVKFAYHCYLKS